ncbi:MAG: bifunctional 5,10-methylenetetrahydrofolate dehydrogenase/5,10-methenyltetrahydrofolate cyclohydrolase [Erysipelothrix sp.]|nr:bifunctional 5,10-methylenetetrahydrofolate dehydrogenase/5,10-methenyltetrahydrofolate cyclohydrolase [Erysipelothrix sp.]
MLLDGKKIAKEIKENLKKEIDLLEKKPHLAVVLVGNDPASLTYVNSKKKQSEALGMISTVIKLEASTTTEALLEVVHTLNDDPNVHGILVQLPLPKHIDTNIIVDAIDVKKDVDGLTPLNVGYLRNDRAKLVPCTPKGIMTLLDKYEIELSGKNVLVIGRSQLVGKPIANLLMARNATVTQAHSKTQNLNKFIENSDIIVVAIGRKEMIKAEDLKENQIVIDVGIHRDDKGLVGDVEKRAYDKVRYITPVPGGVGPMTLVSLFENTLIAYKIQEGIA